LQFRRVSSKPGICIADQSTEARLIRANGPANFYSGLKLQSRKCPTGFSSRPAGEKCQCPTTGCGR
jgi:hypothetical protein